MDVWRTSEGDEIPLNKMSDAHLKNAYAFVSKRLEDGAVGHSVDDDRAWRAKFRAEADRRGISLI